MAQSGSVTIKLDTTKARKRLRSLMALTREANAELAKLDEQLETLEQRADELAEYGIRLEVKA